MDIKSRLAILKVLQEQFSDFTVFLNFVMKCVLGFGAATRIQQDIGKFIVSGGNYLMVMAQRGEAKTTITAAYAVWSLIHNPKLRVLIVSAGDQMASDIAILINQIIMNTPELECLRPESSAGQRTSSKRFDVHYSLKGIDKSPSVSSLGITSNLQGHRADLLIGDDVESSKNSNSAVQRETLVKNLNDFSSICSNGRIILLGTPQSSDSIYNILPARGCNVRIWTGRYPTNDELEVYSGLLSPLLLEDIQANPSLQSGGGLNGTMGKPTDPIMFDEQALCSKELKQGSAHFLLQYMLNTSLLDKNRTPLKPSDIMFLPLPDESVFTKFVYGKDRSNLVPVPSGSCLQGAELYRPISYTKDFLVPYTGCHMYIDPAGGGMNGDETAYAITRYANGFIFVMDTGGIPGGIDNNNLVFLANKAKQWNVNIIEVEKNFGNGMFRKVFQEVLYKIHRCGLEDFWESTRKEIRIIDTLEPVLSTHRIIFNESILESDVESTSRYSQEHRNIYQLFFQLKSISREKGCLKHDDRLDALAGSVRYWADRMAIDADKAHEESKKKRWKEWIKDPMMTGQKRQDSSKGWATNKYF